MQLDDANWVKLQPALIFSKSRDELCRNQGLGNAHTHTDFLMGVRIQVNRAAVSRHFERTHTYKDNMKYTSTQDARRQHKGHFSQMCIRVSLFCRIILLFLREVTKRKQNASCFYEKAGLKFRQLFDKCGVC